VPKKHITTIRSIQASTAEKRTSSLQTKLIGQKEAQPNNIARLSNQRQPKKNNFIIPAATIPGPSQGMQDQQAEEHDNNAEELTRKFHPRQGTPEHEEDLQKSPGGYHS